MREALLQHVTGALVETPGHYYSVRLGPGVLRSFASALSSVTEVGPPLGAMHWGMDSEVGFSSAGPAEGAFDLLPDSSIPERVRDIAFFSVIDQNPTAAVRTKVSGQQKFGQALKTVCIHRVLEFSANEEKCAISFGPALEAGKTNSEFIPMTLHPGTISSHALRDDLYNWEPSPEVEVRVAPHVKVPEELARAMPNVLKMLVSCPAGFADYWDEEGGTAVACLLWLEASHFAEGPPWKLTATGLESITCCLSISVGKKVCSRVTDKDELREGGSVFQLMLELKDQGWEHFELPRKKKEFPMSVVPYVLGGDVMTSAKR